MRKLLIVGAGGHGAVVANVADEMRIYSQIAFLDDGEKDSCLGFSVLGRVKDAAIFVGEYEFFVAIGNGTTRERIMQDLKNQGAVIATLVHPKSVVAKSVTLGEGTVVMAGAVIEPRAVIGEGCIINTSASVNHDVVLGNYTHVAVGAHVAGSVCVGARSWIGVGAAVKNNVNIGSDCIIGAGGVVVKDCIETGTYVGVPAKRISKS